MGLVTALRVELAATTERLAEASYRVIQLESENANLRAAVGKYGVHKALCAGRAAITKDFDTCTCGLTAAMGGKG